MLLLIEAQHCSESGVAKCLAGSRQTIAMKPFEIDTLFKSTWVVPGA
jgi:hypothetical protein